MGKTLTMDYEEYQQDLNQARQQGMIEGNNRGMSLLMKIVLDVVENNSENVEIDKSAHPEIIKFVHRVQAAVGQKLTQVEDQAKEEQVNEQNSGQ